MWEKFPSVLKLRNQNLRICLNCEYIYVSTMYAQLWKVVSKKIVGELLILSWIAMYIYMCMYIYMYVYGMHALVDGMRALVKVMRVHTSMECVRASMKCVRTDSCGMRIYICMYIYSCGMRT